MLPASAVALTSQKACQACILGRTLWLLREMFPNRAFLTLDELAEVLGTPAKTLRNKVPSGIPIAVEKICGHWRVKLIEVAQAIDEGKFDEQQRRRRGRPRKSDVSPSPSAASPNIDHPAAA